jgi:hypothetical protein
MIKSESQPGKPASRAIRRGLRLARLVRSVACAVLFLCRDIRHAVA